MTLYIISAFRPRTIFTNSSFPINSYNFFWRTSGARHCSIITQTPQEIIKVLKENYKLTNQDYSVQEMPKDPKEFFEILSRFIELRWRELPDNTIEVSVVAVGKFIGAGHRNVKAVEEHLGRKIKVAPAIRLRYYDGQYVTEEYEVVDFDGNAVVAEKLNPHYGYRADVVWVAPWGVKSRRKIDDEKLWKNEIMPMFRVPFSDITVHAIRKYRADLDFPLKRDLYERFKDRLYIKRLYRSGNSAEWLIVRRPENDVITCREEVAKHVIGKGGKRIKEISEYFGVPLKVKVI